MQPKSFTNLIPNSRFRAKGWWRGKQKSCVKPSNSKKAQCLSRHNNKHTSVGQLDPRRLNFRSARSQRLFDSVVWQRATHAWVCALYINMHAQKKSKKCEFCKREFEQTEDSKVRIMENLTHARWQEDLVCSAASTLFYGSSTLKYITQC